MKLEVSTLSPRVRRILWDSGFMSIDVPRDLDEIHALDARLYSVPGFGDHSLDEVHEACVRLGMPNPWSLDDYKYPVHTDYKAQSLQEKLDTATALLVKLRDITPDHYPELLDEIDQFLEEE